MCLERKREHVDLGPATRFDARRRADVINLHATGAQRLAQVVEYRCLTLGIIQRQKALLQS